MLQHGRKSRNLLKKTGEAYILQQVLIGVGCCGSLSLSVIKKKKKKKKKKGEGGGEISPLKTPKKQNWDI